MISATDTAPFNFRDKGKMAYVGDNKAVTEIKPANVFRLGRGKMSDYMFWKALYGDEDDLEILGWTGFAIWRYTYVSSMFSYRNQFNVFMDWATAAMFGRPASSSSQGTVGCEIVKVASQVESE